MSKGNKSNQKVDIEEVFELQYHKQVGAMECYRSIFPEGALAKDGIQEQGKYNAIIYADDNKPLYVHDDLLAINICSDFFGDNTYENPKMNCIAYAGNCNRDGFARELYAFVFPVNLHPNLTCWDVDELIRRHRVKRKNTKPKICPTYIVTDEEEVYFYYVLASPIPMYNKFLRKLQNLYNMISREIHRTLDYTESYAIPEPQSIFKRYPVVDSFSRSKVWTAYLIGDKYSLEELNQIVPQNSRLNYSPATHSLEFCEEQWPDWYERRIVQRRKSSKSQFWKNPRALYDWFLMLVKDNIDIVELGVLEALAAYSLKSKDVYSREILSDLEKLGNLLAARFPLDEIEEHKATALGLINDCPSKLKRWSLAYIEALTGLSIPRNKRNGRTQEEHLKIVHEKLSKAKDVKEWRKKHPKGTQAQCMADLGLCRTTVSKHWTKKKSKPKQVSVKNLCKTCGAELEKRKVEPWFWPDRGNYYVRIDKVCPNCGEYTKGRARIFH